MIIKLNPSRYAHCEGHTGVCFSQDASSIITCGGEGDIRVWTGIEDDEATDKCVGEKAFAVCQRGEKLYVATDQNSVQVLTFPEPELDGVVTRFTAPVTDIDASADGSIVVSASCDMTIGVTDLEKGSTETLTGHRAPVLSVALDPKLEYLASSSCDGTVRVWQLADNKEVVSWDCVPKSNSFQHASALGHTAWTPQSGTQLAVPWQDTVRLYLRTSWELTATLCDSSLSGQKFSVAKFSACGQYLAASTTEGHLVIWNVSSHQVLSSVQTDEKQHICSLDWSPQLPQIAFCDKTGNFGTIDLQLDSNKDNEPRPEDIAIPEPTFGDSDEEDGENVISLDKIKNESGFLPGLDDDEDKKSVKEDDGRSSRLSDLRPVAAPPRVELQPPFQPSSTPVSLQYRFMVWNDVGIVKQTNIEDENTIDVEFHDTNHHHSFRINNVLGHTMAALSLEAVVLACEATEDSPSKVVCIMVNAWDGSREWTVSLPEDEEALCVAAGEGFVAVVSDTRLLRVFTTCGTQRELISLPGPVVCMTTYKHTLAVVFHSSVGQDNDQCMSYMQLWLGSANTLERPDMSRVMPLPLAPRAKLRWLGYSDEGSLCSLDMAGYLRKLTPSCAWVPICQVDTQCKGKSDHHFVVGVNEKFQTIRSVLCKGAFFPPTMPRPTVSEISWQVPLCEVSSEKGTLEEQFWRSQTALPTLEDEDRDNADRTIKKTILKLFALACQSGLEMRAVGLCQLMSPEVVQLAVKYASKLGRSQLADKIANTLNERPQSPPSQHRVYEDNSYHQSTSRQEFEPISHHVEPMSQDMFASEDQHSAPEPVNPILALKQRQPGMSSSAMLNSKMKRTNPFVKKASDGKDDTDKGLAGLVKQAAAKPVTKPVEAPAPKTTHTETRPKKNAFMDWFSSQKESLEEEYPELNSSDLTKVALKRFKEEQQKTKSNNAPSVKKFFGSSNTNNEDKKQNENSSNPANEADVESKKRKAEDDDEIPETPEPKKTSTAASKLKKFSFVKP